VARKEFRVSKRNFLDQRPLKLVRILVRTTNGRGVGFSLVRLSETTCSEWSAKVEVATLTPIEVL